MIPDIENSKNWNQTKNVYIEGDNLEVLKLLQRAYAEKVKFIYLDPPYNTGKDFVYHDNFQDSYENYLKQTGQIDIQGNATVTNKETNGRFHTDWLNLMYPRLKLARNLLSNDGIIAMSIDDGELENLRKISSEIFGESNFLGQITYVNNPKGRSQDKYLATSSEYILLYSKAMLTPGEISVQKDNDKIEHQYPLRDANGQYRLIELRNTHREFGKFNRPNLYYGIYVASDGTVLSNKLGSVEQVFPIWNDGFLGCWTWGTEKFQDEIGLLIAKKQQDSWKIYRKDYAEKDGKTLTKVQTLLTDKKFFTEKGQLSLNRLFQSSDKIFQSPKSVALLQLLIEMGTNSDSIVLDFFSGSASTAQAVFEQNIKDDGSRRFIMVQLPEATPDGSVAKANGYNTIAEIGEDRIKRAGVSLQKNISKQIDDGFKLYKMAESTIQHWKEDPASFENQLELLLTNRFTEGSSILDRVFEIAIKYGIPLDVTPSKQNNIYHFVSSDKELFIVMGQYDATIISNLNGQRILQFATVVLIEEDHGSEVKFNLIEQLKQNEELNNHFNLEWL
ncbi:site-specific DNA-methyltransferase [Lacticaseibacillus paracasei]|uniref:site-specific DNA-methyltransferase n=1 Tax=Lacticaseibacillus paracasei TaxID=1597 RepID=UPI00384C9720